MESAAAPSKAKPSLFNRTFRATFRLVFVSILFTGLGMAVGLFTGILATVIGAAISHHAVDLTRASRVFAIPSAMIFGASSFLYQLVGLVRTRVR